jgi:hypothetical protein
MQRKWFSWAALSLSLVLILTSTTPRALAFYPSVEEALLAAISAYNQANGLDLRMDEFAQSGKLAYGSASGADRILVLLAEDQAGIGWSAIVPDQSRAAEYNRLLNAFPESLLDEATKAYLHLYEPPANLGPAMTGSANYSGHKLPWSPPPNMSALLSAKDDSYGSLSHMNQVDFVIWDSKYNKDQAVYASKPGTVVFVKDSSDTNCTSGSTCWKWSNMVVVQHSSTEYTWYVHLAYKSAVVKVGQYVGYGTKLAIQGNTGYSTGIHLHFMASSGRTAWTDPNRPDDAPWATGIAPVDFIEVSWANLTVGRTYTSQNFASSPAVCPSAGGVALFRDAQYGCGGMAEGSGYLLRTAGGFQDLPAGINKQASSVFVPTGWSVMLYQNTNRGGAKRCINAPGLASFAGLYFDGGSVFLNDNVSSIDVFSSANCPTAPVVDTIPPSGDFAAPAEGSTVGRTVTLSANASDSQSGVGEVRLMASWSGKDWLPIYSKTTAPYTYSWDLCAWLVPNGDINLRVDVTDKAGNTFQSPVRKIIKSFNCASPGGEWNAMYWPNTNFSGDPALQGNIPGPLLFRDWGSNSPGENIPADGWSARFSRTANFPGGEYRFHCQSSGGCRLLINQQERFSSLNNTSYTGFDWFGHLPSGSHEIVLEYVDHGGSAQLDLWWQGPGWLPNETCEAGQWCAEHWGNRTFKGPSVMQRNAGESIRYAWGSGSPDPALPADNFSASFIRSANFTCGTYQFTINTVGGLRLWVNGVLQLDKWTEQGGIYNVSLPLPTGSLPLKVEYQKSAGEAALDLRWSRISRCSVMKMQSGPENFVRGGTAFDPWVQVEVTDGDLNPSYADALTFVSGNALSASTIHPVRSIVPTGAKYTFDTFIYSNLRMTAPAAEGLYSSKWQVKGNDGQVGPEATVQVRVDNTLPTVSLPLTWTISNSTSITLTVNAQDTGSGISHVQFYAGYNPGSGWAWHPIGYDADPSGGWSIVWNASQVPDQTNVKFFAYGWDKAGNFNGADTPGVTLDRTPPVSAISALAAAQNSTRFLVKWTASDNLSGIKNFRLQYQVNGGTWISWLTDVPGSTREAWFTGELGKSYGFQIRAEDNAGNVGAYPNSAQTATFVNNCTGDAYEPNNTLASAALIDIDGVSQAHNFCGGGDLDWFRFNVNAGTPYMIYTNRLGSTSETVLTLYDKDGKNLPGESRSTTGSVIIIIPQTSEIMYARVRHADSLVAGNDVTYFFGVGTAKFIYLPVINR